MKDKSIKIVILLIALLGITVMQTSIKAESEKTYDVQITFSSKGNPVYNSKFYLMNLQQAYDKIKNGTITRRDVNSAAWQYVEQQRGVFVKDTFGIDFGVKHNSKATESIIRNMYSSNAGDLVEEINGEAKPYSLHSPGNIARRYTNNSGEAAGEIEPGISGVFDNDGNLVQLIRVKEGARNEFTIDINSTTALFEGKITNLSSNSKANTNSYTVEFGQEINYQLTIDKSLLDQDLPIAINPQANLVIDDISLPYTQVPAYGDVINLQTLDITSESAVNPDASLAILKKQIQTKFYQNILWGYAVNVPKSDEDVTITIKAHLAPEVNFKSNLQGLATDGSLTPMDFVVGAVSPKTQFYLKVDADTSSGSLVYSMPSLRTSGINFASVNSNGTELEKDKKYYLGYKKDGQKYIYGENKWNEMSADDDAVFSIAQQFSNGNQYYLGIPTPQPIPTNPKIFSFNVEKNREINQSLIKFIGLGQGIDYFLLPVENDMSESKEISFSSFNKDSLCSNGQIITSTSIGKARHENYNINSLIPDYRAGSMEYNVTVPSHQNLSTVFRIILGLVGACLSVLLVLIIIYRKG